MTELLRRINEELRKEYDLVTINGREFFVTPNRQYFRTDEFSETGSIVIEYGNNEEEARNGWLEDGDVFPRTLPFAQLMSELKNGINS